MENGELRIENGEWRMVMENGEWRMGNGEWRMEINNKFPIFHFAILFSHLIFPFPIAHSRF